MPPKAKPASPNVLQSATIGKTVDDSLVAIEHDTPRIQDYARCGSALSKREATPVEVDGYRNNSTHRAA